MIKTNPNGSIESNIGSYNIVWFIMVCHWVLVFWASHEPLSPGTLLDHLQECHRAIFVGHVAQYQGDGKAQGLAIPIKIIKQCHFNWKTDDKTQLIVTMSIVDIIVYFVVTVPNVQTNPQGKTSAMFTKR